ncbi:MAG: flagellar biosynthesis protein FlhF [Proteobacteria bacterium]|nr:flagellar biosynthesis protein FlhF [Pseudomonadota bacterium]
MNVKKFVAGTSRDALIQVRRVLGPEALILSNRPVEGGVEILALAKDDLPPFATAPARSQAKQAPAARSGQSTPAIPAAVAAPESDNHLAHSLASEIKSMRGMLEEQLGYQAWDTVQRGDPAKAAVLRDMLRSGFSPALSRQFMNKMPQTVAQGQKLDWVKAVLERNLRTIDAADEIVTRGGVYALVGPTGVGKTTTTAKIAARCVVRHGADQLALLTTDGYRIGAHEQLRIYAKLLGVRVLAIKDPSDLQFALADLSKKHLVLIDTIGMGQRDQMVAEQLTLLSATGTKVERLLLLNATCNGETLDDVVRVYRGGGVHGCIITKTDESVGLATVLDVVIRHQLSLHYVSNGQRVPEDLHLPDRQYLLHRAFRALAAESAHHPNPIECQMMLAAAPVSGMNAGACLA